jgi:hypothetical protein
MLLPDLGDTALLDETGISPALEFLCRCVAPFRGVDRAGTGRAYSVSPPSDRRVSGKDSC